MPSTPLILLGMHRSGTSLLTRSLASLGLFVGWRRQRNDEAVFFRRMNDHIFGLAGGRWDDPGPMKEFLSRGEGVESLVSALTEAARSRQTFSFLGPRRFLRSRSLFALTEPWGWKDPRTTYLVEIWGKVFPQARLVHLVRHGVDVAASLRARHRSRLRDHTDTAPRRPALLQAPPNPAISPRCSTLQGGFTLWQEYLAQAREAMSPWKEEDVLELRYEDLLASPRKVLEVVGTFAGLAPTPEALSRAASTVKPGRGERWKGDEELAGFAREMEAVLAAEGYES